MMRPTKYGTPEYYADLFGDILADVDNSQPAYADAIVEGFIKAVDDWFNYHDEQARTYAELRKRVREALTV
jgi:hypothetical protein